MRPSAILALLLAPASAFGFAGSIHEAISREALASAGYDVIAASEVVAGNFLTDKDEFTDPAAHFDNEAFTAGSARLTRKGEEILDALQACDPARAREHLGRSFHAVQDFFAHANWVETKGPKEPIDLFSMKDPPKDLKCDPVKRQGALTSGYWPDDKRPAPHKCIHKELNKDTPDRPFFALARARALTETEALLSRLDEAILAEFSTTDAAEALKRASMLKGGAAWTPERLAKECRPKKTR